jgi:hypothetical protein
MSTPELSPSPEAYGQSPEVAIPYDEKVLGRERVEQLRNLMERVDSLSFFEGDKDHRALECNKMIEDPTYEPALDYPKMKLEHEEFQKFLEAEQRLLDERDKLIQEDPLAGQVLEKDWQLTPEEEANVNEETVIRVSYLLGINEKLAEAAMIKASATQDYERYTKISESLYGEPSKDIFDWTVRRLRARNRALLARSDNPDIRRLAQELDEMLPDVKAPRTVEVFPFPNKKEFAEMQEDLKKDFAPVVEYLNQRLGHVMEMPKLERRTRKLTSEEMKEITTNVLKIIGAEEQGWVAEVRKGRYFGVSQKLKKAFIPTEEFSYQRFVELTFHEILRHVDSRTKGEKSDLMLLGSGMPGYLQAEEGVAVLYERTISGGEGSLEAVPQGTHLGISLARGLDGKPRTFREVFDILSRVYTLSRMTRKINPLDYKEALQGGNEEAFDRAFRTFRGTDGKHAGLSSTRDIIYDEGDRLLYHYLKKTGNKRQAYTRIFQFGKFDPIPGSKYNRHHLAILRRLPMFNQRLREAGVLEEAA